jgi:F420-non-reducing hydrogenase iron-sulfur subunit
MSAEKWSPHIIGFACNWCTYAGADLAGTSRLSYPPNITLIRVMCTGRIDMQHILAAFAQGADGVFIGGCHPGDCHYLSGNFKAQARVALIRRLLKQFGIDPGRLRLEWISAGEGTRFAEVMADFTEHIRRLGPSAVSPDLFPDAGHLPTSVEAGS